MYFGFMSNMAASASSGTVLFQRGRVSKTKKEKRMSTKLLKNVFQNMYENPY